MPDPPAGRPRRGWREYVETGLYRAHRVACPRSADHRPGGRCDCPWQAAVPASVPGEWRTVTVQGTRREARAIRRRMIVEGPVAPTTPPPGAETLDAHTA